ncbi:protease complex subunit PrcB family protein [Paenibacillus hemerocallicola]|uniref:Protease complex subunit PrcB family protein n=1 Tax=Paenibacillus hemerocallicola TaxID=1172614 RepID=A0A5C4T537_9BACL|nr:S-layer homology domain-containing protein [Paenibacillus hemerocallicola]TNJ64182.1 protease complex subunit PrcB family protein [Paenibacillus hemerocallicola]
MKKVIAATSMALLFSNLVFGTTYAFTDVEAGQLPAVAALQQSGVVNGIDGEHFAPKGKVSFAQSVQMIVKAFDFNLDLMRFAQPPTASGLYANVADDAWYAEAFIIAHYNGLDIPKDANPNASVTREQFAALLMHALEKKANLPMIKIYKEIGDEKELNPENQGAVQRLLHYKIAELDKDGNFSPGTELTRGEAATWVHQAMRVAAEERDRAQAAVEEVSIVLEKVNDEINKVTLSRGVKPNAGYGIHIDSIRFEQDGRAVIRYSLQDPKPDTVYAEVLTEAKAVAYVSSAYKAELEPANGK